MATAGISRSGRVRKKSAKLMEMETESTPNQNSTDNRNTPKPTLIIAHKNVVETNVEEVINKNECDSSPQKKKLKLKLCLNPSPVVTSEDKTQELEPRIESQPKKSMIPVLKIPKSKITGLVTNIKTEDQNSVNNNEIISEIIHSESEDKIKSEPKPEIKTSNEVIIPAVEHKEFDKQLTTISSEEKPKPLKDIKEIKDIKPKKKEQESAANKLFRQITSGIGVTPKIQSNKRGKNQPLEDMTQIPYDEEFSEMSLIIETEDMVKMKSKNRKIRNSKTINDNKKDDIKKTKRNKKDGDGDRPKKKRNAVITAYMIWSKEHRSKIQQNCPDLDFADVSRKLGEIWQSMPEKDKIPWRRKAQKLITTGSSIISTGKQRTSSLNTKFIANTLAPESSPISDDLNDLNSIEDLWQPVGTSPIDVSAHLTLLGESLSTIGQRLKEHSGQIAVSGSLSVLLDSTLCAIGPLLCLTQLHPSLNGCSEEMHKKTLDNIAYIMPGI